MEKKLVLSSDYLKNVLDFSASALVGKSLKRFEIHDDPAVIKVEIKELIYEHYRHLKELLLAFDNGNKFSWEFKNKK